MPLTTELVIFHLILYPKFTLCLSFCGLPHRLSHTGSLLVGFRLGSAGEQWSGIKKKRLENSSSAPLCFGHIQRLHSFRTTATLGGTSHDSNSPSARNDNNFPFCKTLGASTFLVSSVNSTHTCP